MKKKFNPTIQATDGWAAFTDAKGNTTMKKKWCRHIRWDGAYWSTWIPLPLGMNLIIPRTWDCCPIRGCGKRRPK